MELIFISLFVGFGAVAAILFKLYKKFYVDGEEQEVNFGSYQPVQDFEPSENIVPAPREHVAYEEIQNGLIATAVKKAPRAILTGIFIQLFFMLFTGYLSVRNIERLAMAGSALMEGNYGTALMALGPVGKDVAIEQTRVARGVTPYFDENGITNFVYAGERNSIKYAVMENLYSKQDHDNTIKPEDKEYGEKVLGLTSEEANEVCKRKYAKHNGRLITFLDWEWFHNNFLVSRNINQDEKTSEWFYNVSPADNDYYMVMEKKSGIYDYIKDKDIDHEAKDGHIWADQDDLAKSLRIGFRCMISWKEDVK